MSIRIPSSRTARLSAVRDARPGTPRPRGRGGQLTVAAVTAAALVLPVSPVGEDQAAPVVSSPRRAPQLPDVPVQDVPPGGRDRQVVPAQVGKVTPVEELSGSPTGVTALEAIRWCESRDDYRAENPVSSASGGFQFVDSTWEWVTGLPSPASRYPADVQDAAFLELWDDGVGASHWAPSRTCWAPMLNHEEAA